MSSSAYCESWRRACDANHALARWTLIFLDIPKKVQAMYPKDVVCLTGAQVIQDHVHEAYVLVAHTIAMDGYGLKAAQDLREQFRRQHPEFQPSTAMLCSMDTLRDTYGVIWGRVLSDLLLHPDNQPVMYQTFFGKLDDTPDDVVRIAQRRCYQITWAARIQCDDKGVPVEDTLTEWQERDCHSLDLPTASYTYEKHTGERLCPTVYVPLDPERLCHVEIPSP